MRDSLMNAVTPASPPRVWPAENCETLGRCPLCDGIDRRELFGALYDRIFHSETGVWPLWQCRSCQAAYLDPRPAKHMLTKVYETYYTHEQPASDDDGLREFYGVWNHRLRKQMRNDYLNHTFGYRLSAVPGGALVVGFTARHAASASYFIRHLPAPGSGAKLLDAGCGNGRFVRIAGALGYSASGIEPDAAAVRAAVAAGLNVKQAGIPGSGLPAAHFDQITMSHVIEHLHEPAEALSELSGALKPGGRLWIQTPNIDAVGLRVFKEDWIGLSPPHHLVLFNPAALGSLLKRIGFSRIELLSPHPDARDYYANSLAIRMGRNPFDGRPPNWTLGWRRKARAADYAAIKNPCIGESVTMLAWKNL